MTGMLVESPQRQDIGCLRRKAALTDGLRALHLLQNILCRTSQEVTNPNFLDGEIVRENPFVSVKTKLLVLTTCKQLKIYFKHL